MFTPKYFFLQIIDVDDENTQGVLVLKYMKASGNSYVWPEEDDIYRKDYAKIICRLSQPQLINEREQYRFNSNEIHNAKKLM